MDTSAINLFVAKKIRVVFTASLLEIQLARENDFVRFFCDATSLPTQYIISHSDAQLCGTREESLRVWRRRADEEDDARSQHRRHEEFAAGLRSELKK